MGALSADSRVVRRGLEAPSGRFRRTTPWEGTRTEQPGLLTGHQVRHPDQIVGRSHEVPRQSRALHTTISSAADPSTVFIHPNISPPACESSGSLHSLYAVLSDHLSPSELAEPHAASVPDHACPSHTAECRSPCHLPASWDGSLAAAHRHAWEAIATKCCGIRGRWISEPVEGKIDRFDSVRVLVSGPRHTGLPILLSEVLIEG